MSPYLITGIIAGALGIALGGAAVHTVDATKLATEQTSHARDNEINAQKLQAVSDAAASAARAAIAKQNDASTQIASLDAQLIQEKASHDADNAKNRAAIADGARRLRVAVTAYTPASSGNAADSGASAGSVGNGAGGTAELSPAFGSALFGIVDDADSDARAKAEYLQHYVCILQQQGVIAGACSLTTTAKE
ncbi:lysis system i-spanin subunit Rz [Caballeronia sp. LZ028]|uniref:lysis system i-spanin subunit Rz n=1 Tax=Caballeronia sp. LZ028 TaxID=3038563 RepID=UPI00286051D6|nr:lysis system i-spanin subunit Rz [Caballeronia sp. LZ028]MDR5765058.1 lysis system i-spanin subunit Rz [Caballeronia sp. LZ028]